MPKKLSLLPEASFIYGPNIQLHLAPTAHWSCTHQLSAYLAHARAPRTFKHAQKYVTHAWKQAECNGWCVDALKINCVDSAWSCVNKCTLRPPPCATLTVLSHFSQRARFQTRMFHISACPNVHLHLLPMKTGKRAKFFEGKLTDGTKTMRMVGFWSHQQNQLATYHADASQ